MAEERLTRAIEEGMKLSKRILLCKQNSNKYYSVSPPQQPIMEKILSKKLSSSSSFNHSSYLLPTSPMVYAVISDPIIVDNPDIPSYQPHIHGNVFRQL